jgi:hypothetical protein
MWGVPLTQRTSSCALGNSLFTGEVVGDILLPSLLLWGRDMQPILFIPFLPALIHFSGYLRPTPASHGWAWRCWTSSERQFGPSRTSVMQGLGRYDTYLRHMHFASTKTLLVLKLC